MIKQAYVTPSLHTFGAIESLTGTIGCYPVVPNKPKGVGYESDTSYKFIPICDLDSGDDDLPS